MKCAFCGTKHTPSQKVQFRAGKNITVCDKTCAGKYDKKHEKQTSIIPKWEDRIHMVKRLEAENCSVLKITTKVKDGSPVQEVQIGLPGKVSVDAIKEFIDDGIVMEISRSHLEKPKTSKKEKAA